MSRTLKLLVMTGLVSVCGVPFASAASKTTTKSTATMVATSSTLTVDTTCPTTTPTPVFSRWGDASLYFLAAGGSMENPGYWPGATFVADNDSYALAGAGTKALRLTADATAASSWTCQGAAYPTLRFMVRNVGTATAKLTVLMQVAGSSVAVPLATMTAGPSWAPSPIVSVPTALLPDGVTLPQIQVSFVATGAGADFRVDDLFVDPRSRG